MFLLRDEDEEQCETRWDFFVELEALEDGMMLFVRKTLVFVWNSFFFFSILDNLFGY